MALKVRELLQPAARERQGERTDLKPKVPDITADRRSSSPVAATAAQQVTESFLTEQRRQDRNVAAQAAKAVGAAPRNVEKAARVAKVAPDLLPQVQAGTMALDKAHREAQQRPQPLGHGMKLAGSRLAQICAKLSRRNPLSRLYQRPRQPMIRGAGLIRPAGIAEKVLAGEANLRVFASLDLAPDTGRKKGDTIPKNRASKYKEPLPMARD